MTKTKLEKWVLSEMMDKLEDLEDREVCLSELSWDLFEQEKRNSSYWCSYYLAKEWVKEYFDDLGDVVEEMVSDWGSQKVLGESVPDNVFSQTETFQVQVVLYLADRLQLESQYILDNWDENIVLTESIIKQIKDEWQKAMEA